MKIAEQHFESLVSEIKSGRCVAFVGAGFSAPVCRGWGELLIAVAEAQKDPRISELVAQLVQRGTGRDYEVAAQIVEDAFEPAELMNVVRQNTPRPTVTAEQRATMKHRTEMLRGIPFATILTTNFDDVLAGEVLDGDTYAELLREADRRWVENRFWRRGSTSVLKLHGELRGTKGITLSRRGYRARLYADPGYLHVLRTVFLTKTLLFIGFSFNDEYLNELRSEALAYLGPRGAHRPLAYAIVPDMPAPICAHFVTHEGIQPFVYESGAAFDHSPADTFLERLHDATNPVKIMGNRLSNKRILWVDPSDQNNARGRAHLVEASRGLCTIDLAASPSAGIAMLANQTYDLVITRWGHHPRRAPDAVELLEAMRKTDLRAPVIIFASGAFAAENRERALGLGALDYTSSWEELFELIDRRFVPV